MTYIESTNAFFKYGGTQWSSVKTIRVPSIDVTTRDATVIGDTVRKTEPAPLGRLQPFTVDLRQVTGEAQAVMSSLFNQLLGTQVTASLAEIQLNANTSFTCSAYPTSLNEIDRDSDSDDPTMLSITFTPADSGSWNFV